MSINSRGLALIKEFEGLYLTSYKCPAGVWTIGWGHTGKVAGKSICSGMRITTNVAEELLKADLKTFETSVNKLPYKLNENQFAALVSFAFNCGEGNLTKLTQNNTRTLAQISNALPLYNKANGTILVGLTRRRQAEQELFNTASTTVTTVAKTEDVINMRTIKSGSTGTIVKVWQTILGVTTDGKFGTKTTSATKTWQKKKGLTVDGIVGDKTWTKALESL